MRENGWRCISITERAEALLWLEQFKPYNQKEQRDYIILDLFIRQNKSAQAISRMNIAEIVSTSNRSKGKPLSCTSILEIIYWYFPQFRKRYNGSKTNQARKELKIKREKKNNPHITQCAFCGNKNNLEEHHMIPLFMGGTNDDENLIFLCKECHKSVTNYQMKIRKGSNNVFQIQRQGKTVD